MAPGNVSAPPRGTPCRTSPPRTFPDFYIHRFTDCRRLRQAHYHNVGLCGTSPICRSTGFVAAEARVPCQFHAAAAFESFPRQLVLLLLREDFQAPIPFLLKANHFLLCQWLTLMCGTVPIFFSTGERSHDIPYAEL